MAWSLVGTTSAVITAGAGNQTVTLPGTVAQNDLVIVATAADISCADCVATASYTAPDNGTGANPGANFAYKLIGSGETSVDIVRHATVLRAVAVQVWRGGDTGTILDAAYATPAVGTSAAPASPAITTATADALVVLVAFLDDDDSTVSTTPANYNNLEEGNTGQASTTVGATIAIASRVLAAPGTETPAAWGMSSSDQWRASTIAFRLAETNLSRAAGPDSVKVDDSGYGIVELRGLGGVKVSDTVTAALSGGVDLTPNLLTETVKDSDAIAVVLDPLQTPALTESLRVTDAVAPLLTPLDTTALEAVRVSDALTVESGLVALASEALRVVDSVATRLDPLETAQTEALRVSDLPALTLNPLQTTVADAVRLSDSLAAESGLAALVSEGLVVADSVATRLDPLEASTTDALRVSDTSAQTLDPLHATPSDAVVRVSDAATAEVLGGLSVGLQEAIKGDDIGQGLAILGDGIGVIHCTDGPVMATLGDALLAAPTEALKARDTLQILREPLAVTLTDALRVSDIADSFAQLVSLEAVRVSDGPASAALFSGMEVSVAAEGGRVSDALSVALELAGALADSVRVSDSVQATLSAAGTLDATLTEAVAVTDPPAVQLALLQQAVAEAVISSDSLTAQITPLQQAVTETLHLTDGPPVGTSGLEGNPTEGIRVSDVLTITANPLQAVALEAVTASEGVIGTVDPLTVSLADTVHVSDGPAIGSSGQATALTDSVRVTETVQVTLTLLEAAAAEGVRGDDAAQGRLDPLEVLRAEGCLVSDSLTVIGFLADPIEFVVVAAVDRWCVVPASDRWRVIPAGGRWVVVQP